MAERRLYTSHALPSIFAINIERGRDVFEKDVENFGEFFRDHCLIASHLPTIAAAYVGTKAIEPQIGEAIMLTMNSVNNCGYCLGLHGELGRMAGIEPSMCNKMNSAKSVEESLDCMKHPAIKYCRQFATLDGKKKGIEEADAELDSSIAPLTCGTYRQHQSAVLVLTLGQSWWQHH